MKTTLNPEPLQLANSPVEECLGLLQGQLTLTLEVMSGMTLTPYQEQARAAFTKMLTHLTELERQLPVSVEGATHHWSEYIKAHHDLMISAVEQTTVQQRGQA